MKTVPVLLITLFANVVSAHAKWLHEAQHEPAYFPGLGLFPLPSAMPQWLQNNPAYPSHPLHFRGPVSRSTNPAPAPPPTRILDALVPDFQVNENAGRCHCHFDPQVAAADSIIIAVWTNRLDPDWDIYAQRFDVSGNPIGTSFRVNDDEGIGDQSQPSLAATPDGAFVIAWADERNGNWDIYAERFDRSGNPIGANFRVNDDEGSGNQSRPSLAATPDGAFVIAWQDTRNGNQDIYAQRFDASGNPTGTNFRVNGDDGSRDQSQPSLAATPDGAFIVAWQDRRNGSWDIYAQGFNASGNPTGTNFRVNRDEGSADQWDPSLAIAPDGAFIVAWQDRRNGNWDIYAQGFNASGNPTGTNFRVNGDEGSADQHRPSLATTLDGTFVIAWEDTRNGNYDIYAQRFDSGGNPIGANFRVSDSEGSGNRWAPSLASTPDSGFIVAWIDRRNDSQDIYARRFDLSGNPVGTDFRVNHDEGSTDQQWPSLATTPGGAFIVTWADKRNGNWNIYAQRLDASGKPVRGNFRVNDREGNPSNYSTSSVATTADGAFIVAWAQFPFDIFVQRFDSSGNRVGTNVRVNDDEGNTYQYLPSLATSSDGSFIIAWMDDRNGDFDIYAQRFDPSGSPKGANFRVNDDEGSARQSYPSIATTPNGAFVVAWTDERSGQPNIYVQRFDPSGDPIGTNFRINDDEGNTHQYLPSLATTPDGAFVIAWEDTRSGNWDIYVQRFDPSGTPIGTDFRVNDDEDNTDQYGPSLATDSDGAFILAWTDERNGNPDIYAQRFDASGNPIGGNFVVTANRQKTQKEPDVAIWNGRIYSVWTTNHVGGTGWDIWANVLDWNNPSPTHVASDRPVVPADLTLQPAYPNPFNDATVIAFSLPRVANVELAVYDAYGRRVRTLLSGELSAGRHRVTWDARDGRGSKVASGLYICRATANGRQFGVIKLLYVR